MKPRLGRVAWTLAAALPLLVGCGYSAALAPGAAPEPLAVAAAPFATPHVEAVTSALSGARAELTRWQALGRDGTYPRLVVEVLRVDELPAGVAAVEGAPLGRASQVGVSLRAWVEAAAGSGPTRDSGDVRRVESVAQSGAPLADTQAFDAAVRAAARRAAEAATRRVLGVVEPATDPL